MKIIRTGHWCTEDVKTAHSYPSPLQIPSDNEEAAEFLFSLLSSTAHSVLVAAILCLKALAEVYSHHTVKEENVEVTCNFSSPPPKRFFEKHSKRTRGNGHKKQQEIFQSDARKKNLLIEGGQILDQVAWPGCGTSTYRDICNSTR